jgi:hypothetical protein
MREGVWIIPRALDDNQEGDLSEPAPNDFRVCYNMAPTQRGPMIRRD